jgi:hypothetical protein
MAAVCFSWTLYLYNTSHSRRQKRYYTLAPCSWAPFEKAPIARRVNNFQKFYEPRSSITGHQESATGPYPDTMHLGYWLESEKERDH